MTEYTILHNPRCSKSKQALQLFEDNNITPTIIQYLIKPLNVKQLNVLFKKMKCSVRQCIRTKESLYTKLNLKDPSLSDTQLIQTISNNPSLLERPIIYTSTDAVIGRPLDNVIRFLQQQNINL